MGRDELLDAAFRVLARSGDVRPEAVAQEAGASKALVFHHFASVDGLRDAMAARVLAETQAGLDALADDYPNPRERLDALARALLSTPPESPPEARRVLRFWLQGDRGAARDALLADFVARTLREAHARADAVAVASLLLARWHGATMVYAMGGAIDLDREQGRVLAELRALV